MEATFRFGLVGCSREFVTDETSLKVSSTASFTWSMLPKMGLSLSGADFELLLVGTAGVDERYSVRRSQETEWCLDELCGLKERDLAARGALVAVVQLGNSSKSTISKSLLCFKSKGAAKRCCSQCDGWYADSEEMSGLDRMARRSMSCACVLHGTTDFHLMWHWNSGTDFLARFVDIEG